MSTTNTTSDFQTRASAAATRISQLNPAELIAQSLANDRPTIESAIKSFTSLVVARSLTATKTDTTTTAIVDTGRAGGAGADVGGGEQGRRVDEPSTTGGRGRRKKCYFATQGTDARVDALKCARAMLRAINTLNIPSIATDDDKEEDSDVVNSMIAGGGGGGGGSGGGASITNDNSTGEEAKFNEETKLEYNVVRIVWNGLITSEMKPSKFLGRTALRYAYPFIMKQITSDKHGDDDDEGGGPNTERQKLLPKDVDRNCAIAFFEEFDVLLYRKENGQEQERFEYINNEGQDAEENDDDDSALLWHADGGASELARRRARRAKRGEAAAKNAAERLLQVSSGTSCSGGLSTDAIEEGITEDETSPSDKSDDG